MHAPLQYTNFETSLKKISWETKKFMHLQIWSSSSSNVNTVIIHSGKRLTYRVFSYQLGGVSLSVGAPPLYEKTFSGVWGFAHFRWFPAYFFLWNSEGVRFSSYKVRAGGSDFIGEWGGGPKGARTPPMGPEFRCAGAPKIRNEGLFFLKWTCAPLRQFWPYAYDCASFPTRTSPYWILH